MQRPPQPPSLQAQFSGMPAEYLACRDLGHDWVLLNTEPIKGGWERQFRCGRCKTVRHQEIDRRGYIIANHYPERPEGYSVVGHGVLDVDARAVGRLANIREMGN